MREALKEGGSRQYVEGGRVRVRASLDVYTRKLELLQNERSRDVMWGVLESRSHRGASNSILHSEIAFHLSIRPAGREEGKLAFTRAIERESK